MTDTAIMTMLGFLVSVVTIITAINTPLRQDRKENQRSMNDLNAAIVKLTAAIDNLSGKHDDLKETVDEHGEQIHSLEVTAAGHDVRIRTLEGRSTDE